MVALRRSGIDCPGACSGQSRLLPRSLSLDMHSFSRAHHNQSNPCQAGQHAPPEAAAVLACAASPGLGPDACEPIDLLSAQAWPRPGVTCPVILGGGTSAWVRRGLLAKPSALQHGPSGWTLLHPPLRAPQHWIRPLCPRPGHTRPCHGQRRASPTHPPGKRAGAA